MIQNVQASNSRLVNRIAFPSPTSNISTMDTSNSMHSAARSNSTVTAGGGSNHSQDVGGLANHQHSSGSGSGSDYGVNMPEAPLSPQSTSQSGTTLKEHVFLGQSEVSSSCTVSSPKKNFDEDGELNLNLNLGSTDLRLGSQEAARKDSGFELNRASVASDEGVPATSETGNFLGGLNVGNAADPNAFVSERRLSNADQNVGIQDQVMERGFTYNSLVSAPVSQGGRGDALEAPLAPCRQLIDSESLQKRHGGDRSVGPNESVVLGTPVMQKFKRGVDADEVSEKAFVAPVDRHYREMTQQEDPCFYKERSWTERPEQKFSSVQQDLSLSEKSQDRHVAMNREHIGETPSEKTPGRSDSFQGEKRNLPEGITLPPVQPPEARFNMDMNGPERSPRQEDYVAHPHNMLQYQSMYRAGDLPRHVPAPDFHGLQMAHSAHQEESSSQIFSGHPLGGFPGPRVLQQQAPSKIGVSGAKRSYDTIGFPPDARSYVDTRNGQQLPGQVLNNNVTSAQYDLKSKGQTASMPQQQWGAKPPPAWQMLQHASGSFGPFPSKAPGRAPALPPTNKSPSEVTGSGSDPSLKAWENHAKSLQELASTSQSMSCTAENKPVAASEPTPAADSGSPPRASTSHAVGWPPLRSFRKNVLAANPRPSPAETQSRPPPPPPPPQQVVTSPASVASQPNSRFVKVYMDGVPIGRKVDLKTNSSYELLTLVLEDMFRGFVNGQQNALKRDMTLPSDKHSFLHGSDYVLTYEDQDSDLMLVGDVPWTLFIGTVKRLRIMKGSEAIGLGTRASEKVSKAQSTV